jgi:hypothetical protein
MSDLKTPQSASQTLECKSCRLPIDPKATTCPHCHSSQRPLGFWRQAGVYIPVLSFAVTILSLLPGAFNAAGRFFRPPALPTASVLVTDLDLTRNGLAPSLVNFGNEVGVVDRFATCWVKSENVTPQLGFEFLARERPILTIGAHIFLPFDAEVRGLVALQGQTIQRVLGDPQTRSLSRLRELLDPATLAAISTVQGGRIDPIPDVFQRDCTIRVDGPNDPSPVQVHLQLSRGISDEDEVTWLPEPLTP